MAESLRLSKHFDLSEFLRSETAARHDIAMEPTPEVLINLKRLAAMVLDQIRERAAVPIVVTSGYRPIELNRLVGGAPNSDHVKGLAADIHALGMPLDELGKIIRSMRDEIPMKKVIWEFGQWLHVAVTVEGEEPQAEFLTATRELGKTIYRTWNV